MPLLLLAVPSHFTAGGRAGAETAAGDGVAVLLWPIRRTIGVMVRQRATGQAPCRCSWCCVSPTPSGVRLGTWLGSAACPRRTRIATWLARGSAACPRRTRIAPAEMLLLLLLAVLSHSTAVVVSSGSAETAAGDVCRGCAAVADSQRTIGVMVRQ